MRADTRRWEAIVATFVAGVLVGGLLSATVVAVAMGELGGR